VIDTRSIGVALVLALGGGFASAADSPHGPMPEGQWKLVESYCVECHNVTDWAGGVAFDSMTDNSVADDAKVWEQAVRKLRGGLMPPPGSKQPDAAATKGLVSWLEGTLDSAAPEAKPGRVPLRRLNRREYANAVRDLVGLEVDPSAWLPSDPLRDGFDTDAALLQVTPNFLDQSVTAARALALQAVGDPKAAPIDTTYGNIANMIISLNPRPSTGAGNQQKYKDGMPFGTRGGMVVEHVFPADGEYSLTIGDMALAREVPKLEFKNTVIALLDGKEFYRVDVGGEEDHKSIDQKLDDAVFRINSRLRDIRFTATAGQHKVAVTFLRRSYAESDERVRPNTLDGGQQRVNAVHALQIKGPMTVTGISDSPSRQKIFICKPATPAEEGPCAQKIVANLAQTAFRRPVSAEDLKPLLGFYERGRAGGTFDVGIRDAVAAILASPLFLYRAEAAGEGVRTLTDLELASRMSFFIWSSLPDAELLALATKNELSKPEVLKAQVHRMIRDPRAASLTNDFAFQWLNVAKMDTISPAQALFSHAAGTYDPRPMFRKELELFIDSILRSDRSVVDLLTADHTYINEQLALLYGMEDVKGSGFRRVTLTDTKRFGLLGKGAVLMLTANPDRTAPVLRGAWILERILGTPAANPPNNVPDLNASAGAKPTTVRERTEIHRRNPACASCHAVMDPLGFALENFDTVGQFRAIDPQTRTAIDTAATMPDGTHLKGPEDLHQALASRGPMMVQAITEKLMSYAVGRHIDHADMPTVRRIARESAADNYKFESIVLGVVNSDAFRRRESAVPLPASTKTAQVTAASSAAPVSQAP
jgi:mono/diheme cytochrome c family protein